MFVERQQKWTKKEEMKILNYYVLSYVKYELYLYFYQVVGLNEKS